MSITNFMYFSILNFFLIAVADDENRKKILKYKIFFYVLDFVLVTRIHGKI